MFVVSSVKIDWVVSIYPCLQIDKQFVIKPFTRLRDLKYLYSYRNQKIVFLSTYFAYAYTLV